MTLIEVKTAMRNHLAVQVCGATAAKLYGKIKYRRIQRINFQYGKDGKPYYTAELVAERNVLYCGIEDVELSDDVPTMVRAEFEKMTKEEQT